MGVDIDASGAIRRKPKDCRLFDSMTAVTSRSQVEVEDLRRSLRLDRSCRISEEGSVQNSQSGKFYGMILSILDHRFAWELINVSGVEEGTRDINLVWQERRESVIF